jgi:hypothetical protein
MIDRPPGKTDYNEKRKNPNQKKSERQKGRKQQTPWKSRKSSETTLRTYIIINLKILNKWTDF